VSLYLPACCCLVIFWPLPFVHKLGVSVIVATLHWSWTRPGRAMQSKPAYEHHSSSFMCGSGVLWSMKRCKERHARWLGNR